MHTFSIYCWPKGLLKVLNRAIQNYFWIGSFLTKKPVTVNRTHCGLVSRIFLFFNKALFIKLAWKILSRSFSIFQFSEKSLQKQA